MSQVVSVDGRPTLGRAASKRITVYDSNRQAARALTDVTSGLKAWPLWGTLAWDDIRQRYARSILGPFWLTLSMAILVTSLGFIYGGLFSMPLPVYLPYLGTGFIIWSFISLSIVEGCHVFTVAAGTIKQVAAPLSVYAIRLVWRNFIVFLHNILIYVLIVVLFPVWPGLTNILLATLAFALLCINGFCVALVLGMISARFRDVPPLVASLVQVAFFVTPIFWHADQLPRRYAIVDYNPFLYYVEIVRQPLLGNAPDTSHWAVVIILTLVGSLLSFVFFAQYRRRIAYWV
jgi:ABC-2 type transport system permease protein/lipopolysaccharide transport system permease protein